MRLIRARLYAKGGDHMFTPEEQTAILAAKINDLDENERAVFTTDGKSEYWYGGGFLWDLDTFPIEHIGMLDDIKYIPLTGKLQEALKTRDTTVYNEHVNVIMPGLGMLQLNRVQVLYNCCTDELGENLKQGWRIVAVCPQPHQRRPDYVLGRVE